MEKKKIKIDIVSDVVCPWCYIGKRRIERAIERLKDTYDFELVYHPFELNPSIPASGLDQKQYLSNRFGGEARYIEITKQVSAAAAKEGLQFDFEKQKISPNTRQVHRIIQFAKQKGKQPEVKEAFMKAYFEQGADLSKKENLITIATQAGLNREQVNTLLTSDEGLLDIERAEKELQKLGITGVPFYILDNKYGISGAQPTEVFIQAFEDIAAEITASEE